MSRQQTNVDIPGVRQVLWQETPQGWTYLPGIWTALLKCSLLNHFSSVCKQTQHGIVNSAESDSRLDVLQWRPDCPISSATKGGWRLCFHHCLSVFEQDISKSYGWILTKFDWQFGCGTRMKWLDFCEYPLPVLDMRIFKVILHHWKIEPKTIYSTISQKVMDGFRRTRSG